MDDWDKLESEGTVITSWDEAEQLGDVVTEDAMGTDFTTPQIVSGSDTQGINPYIYTIKTPDGEQRVESRVFMDDNLIKSDFALAEREKAKLEGRQPLFTAEDIEVERNITDDKNILARYIWEEDFIEPTSFGERFGLDKDEKPSFETVKRFVGERPLTAQSLVNRSGTTGQYISRLGDILSSPGRWAFAAAEAASPTVTWEDALTDAYAAREERGPWESLAKGLYNDPLFMATFIPGMQASQAKNVSKLANILRETAMSGGKGAVEGLISSGFRESAGGEGDITTDVALGAGLGAGISGGLQGITEFGKSRYIKLLKDKFGFSQKDAETLAEVDDVLAFTTEGLQQKLQKMSKSEAEDFGEKLLRIEQKSAQELMDDPTALSSTQPMSFTEKVSKIEDEVGIKPYLQEGGRVQFSKQDKEVVKSVNNTSDAISLGKSRASAEDFAPMMPEDMTNFVDMPSRLYTITQYLTFLRKSHSGRGGYDKDMYDRHIAALNKIAKDIDESSITASGAIPKGYISPQDYSFYMDKLFRTAPDLIGTIKKYGDESDAESMFNTISHPSVEQVKKQPISTMAGLRDAATQISPQAQAVAGTPGVWSEISSAQGVPWWLQPFKTATEGTFFSTYAPAVGKTVQAGYGKRGQIPLYLLGQEYMQDELSEE